MAKRLKIADLKFDPQNARVRTAKGEAMIQESLRQVGAARSIVIDEDGTILAGNGTVEAAGQVGIENVVIVEASGDEIIAVKRVGLTDEQKKKLAYYDNRTGDEAEWDMEQVARDLLGGYEFLDELFDNIEVPAPEKEGTDELPEDPAEVLREKWGVEYGDLWEIGPHRILCGDSTKKEDVDRLLDGRRLGAILTDPPYGIDLDTDYTSMGGFAGGGRKHRRVEGDDSDFDPKPIWDAWGDPADQFWFGADYYADKIPKGGAWLVWDKRLDESADKMYGSCFEIIYSKRKVKRDILRHKWAGIFGMEKEDTKKRLHPTQKPSFLIEDVMRRIKTAGPIGEPFGGSGSTMVAAHNESRTCYAMEIDPAYVAVCIERMAQLGYDPDKVENLEG